MTDATRASADARWDVPTVEALRRFTKEPLPLKLTATAPTRTFFRDVFYDTSDLTLRARGVTCRVRHRSDDRHELSVEVVSEADGEAVVTSAQADVPGGVARAALDGNSEPVRLLRAIVNPAAIDPQLELESEVFERLVSSRSLRPARFALDYAIVTVRGAGLSRSFHEISQLAKYSDDRAEA